jgi:hypothetical protein
MKWSIGFVAATALVVLASTMPSVAPASAAGTCDQQGVRRKIGGLWHKFVLVGTEKCGPSRYCARWLDCGAFNAF